MREGQRIRVNSFFSFLSSAIRAVTNVLLFVGIARFYGAEAFGQFTAAHTYLTMFLLLADFGFDLLIATEIARDVTRTQALVATLIPLKMAFGCLAVLLMCALALIQPLSAETRLLMLILSVSIVGNTVATAFFAVCKGREQLHHETRTSLLQNIVLLLTLLALGIARVPLTVVAISFVGSKLFGAAHAAWSVWRTYGFRFASFSFEGWRQALKAAIPFGVHLVFGTLYFQLDTLLITAWLGDYSVGVYQSVMKLAAFVLIIPDVIVGALLPVLSRLNVEDREKWIQLGRIANKTMLFIGLPFALLFSVYGDQIISMVYGPGKFEQAIPVLRVFGPVLMIRFSVEVFALLLTTSRRQLTRMWIVVGATCANFGLNAFAIPRYGVMGAAVVSLITNAATGLAYIVAVEVYSRRVGSILESRLLFLLVGTVCAGVLLWNFLPGSLLPGGVVTLIGCPLAYYFLGYSREERSMVFSLQRTLQS